MQQLNRLLKVVNGRNGRCGALASQRVKWRTKIRPIRKNPNEPYLTFLEFQMELRLQQSPTTSSQAALHFVNAASPKPYGHGHNDCRNCGQCHSQKHIDSTCAATSRGLFIIGGEA